MSKEVEIEPYYKKQGQDVVDMLYDNKIINPELTRQDMRIVEDYISYLFQSHAETASKATLMVERIKHR